MKGHSVDFDKASDWVEEYNNLKRLSALGFNQDLGELDVETASVFIEIAKNFEKEETKLINKKVPKKGKK